MRHTPSLLLVCFSFALHASGADAPAAFKVSEFTFTRPTAWEWIETKSEMRKAQMKISSADKKQSAEVVFYYFGEGGAGGVQANVQRWLSQFEEPKEKLNSRIEEVTIGKHKVTYVQAEGTYKSGMPGGPSTPQPNSVLLGAILESDAGNVFIKLTGPVALAKTSKDEFRKMVESALK